MKLLGLCIAAMLAFGALSVASASASQPEAKDENGENPAGTAFTEKQPTGGVILETEEGHKVECDGTEIDGEFTSETTTIGILIVNGCEDPETGATCTGTNPEGEEPGEIKFELEGELVYTGAEANVPGMWFWSSVNGKGT